MTTLVDLRRLVGYHLNEMTLAPITTGTTTTVTSTTLIDSGADSAMYNRNWIYIPGLGTDNQERRVAAYNPATGMITLSRAVSVAPTSYLTMEIHTMLSATQINWCINMGLFKCTYLYEQEITPVAGQTEYSLSAYASWLTSKDQVYDALWRYGDTVGEYTYQRVRWFNINENGGVLSLRIRNDISLTGATLILQTIRPYDGLIAEASTTTCPLDWVRDAAIAEIYALLVRSEPNQEQSRHLRFLSEARTIFYQRCRQYAPRVQRRTQHGTSIPLGEPLEEQE